MKLLYGSELAEYVKERQAKQVRGLRQAWKVLPRVVIIIANNEQPSRVYVRLKRVYGEDILVDVDVYELPVSAVAEKIDELNANELIHGIVLQLPLEDPNMTEELVARIASEKDVDGLGPDAAYPSATALAIDWLLAGYNVDLQGRRIAVVGQGRLVGAPLTARWAAAGLDVHGYDDGTDDLAGELRQADVIVSATGVPRLITPEMLKPGAVIVDAGTASENGVLVGDVAPSVRERGDITITPEKGGVGPLTVAALFDNVITAARKVADEKGKQ